jgi:hypothetical protein
MELVYFAVSAGWPIAQFKREPKFVCDAKASVPKRNYEFDSTWLQLKLKGRQRRQITRLVD